MTQFGNRERPTDGVDERLCRVRHFFFSCGVKLSEREREKKRVHDDFKYNHKDGYSQSLAFVTLQKFYFFHF